MKKGQLSLEMIIMLVVLLVLAGVLITLIIHFLRPEAFKAPEKETFRQNCERWCNEKNIKFCKAYWDGSDWNENEEAHEVVEVGEYNWLTCEDRIYCFLLVSCPDWLGRGIKQIKRCKELLCKKFIEKYEDKVIASDEVKKLISFSENCGEEEIRNRLVELDRPEKEFWPSIFEEEC